MKIGLTAMLTDTTPDVAAIARKCEAFGFEPVAPPVARYLA